MNFRLWEAFGLRAKEGLYSRVVQSACGEGREELQVFLEEGAASMQALSHSQGAPTHGTLLSWSHLLPGHL